MGGKNAYICKKKSMEERAKRSQLEIRGKNQRNELDRAKDVWWEVGELAKGRTYREIASELTERNGYYISAVSVYNDLNRALVEWKRENMDNIDAYIARELARLEEIERRVLIDYDRSKTLRPAEYAALMKRGLTIEEIDEIYRVKGRELAGDPRYLETLLHLQRQRMDLLGLKGNDVAQNTIIAYNFSDIKIEELTSLADKMQEGKFKELTGHND